MKRRLPASILVVLMVLLVIVAAQTALGAPAVTVRGDIPVEKQWDHGTLPVAQQPQRITAKLVQGSTVVQQITLTKGTDGRWLGAFRDVPLFANGAVVSYTVTEEPLENYTMTAVQLPSPGTVSGTDWSDKITPASESTYPIGSAEVVVANQGGTYDVWSLHTLNAVQQQSLVEQINRANLQGLGATLKLGSGGNTEFRFGLPAKFQDKKGNTVELRAGQNGTEISFGKTSVWSLFYPGSMTVEEARGAIIKNVYQAPATPTPNTPTPGTPTPNTPTPGTPTPGTPTPNTPTPGTPTPTTPTPGTPTPGTPTPGTPTPGTPTPATPTPGTPTPSTPTPNTPTPATPTPGTPTPNTPTPATPTPATPTATPKPTPEPEIPKTGDSRNAMVWLGLALAAGAALLVLQIRKFKRAK